MNVKGQVYSKQKLIQVFEETIREDRWLLANIDFPLLTLRNSNGVAVASNNKQVNKELIKLDKSQCQVFKTLLIDGYFITIVVFNPRLFIDEPKILKKHC